MEELLERLESIIEFYEAEMRILRMTMEADYQPEGVRKNAENMWHERNIKADELRKVIDMAKEEFFVYELG